MDQTTRANPWGLTAKEEQSLRAVCEHGCNKLAAAALCRSVKTVEYHNQRAGKKMPQRTPLSRLIAFDRWDRSQNQ